MFFTYTVTSNKGKLMMMLMVMLWMFVAAASASSPSSLASRVLAKKGIWKNNKNEMLNKRPRFTRKMVQDEDTLVDEDTLEEEDELPYLYGQQHADKNRQLFENKVSLLYQASMTTTILDFNSCSYPTSATFNIACGGEIVWLDDDENLGLARCTQTSPSTMTCTETSLHLPHASAAAIFECVGSTPAELQATVELEEDTVDCSKSWVGLHTYGRTLSLGLVCRSAVDWLIQDMWLQDVVCDSTSSQRMQQVWGTCFTTEGCGPFSGGPSKCGRHTLPELSVEVRDTEFPDKCIWPAEEPVVLSPFPDNTPRQANYLASILGWTLPVTDACVMDKDPHAVVSCGVGGTLVAMNTFGTILDETFLANLGCTRTSGRSITCPMDTLTLNPLGQWDAVLVIGCAGTTPESWSIEMEFDPEYMTCRESQVDNLSILTYTTTVYQVCEQTLIPDYPHPYDKIASLTFPECAPVSVTKLVSVNVTNYNLETITLAGKGCTVARVNCHGAKQCDAQGGQSLGPIRSFVSPERVSPTCLTTPGVNLNFGGLGLSLRTSEMDDDSPATAAATGGKYSANLLEDVLEQNGVGVLSDDSSSSSVPAKWWTSWAPLVVYGVFMLRHFH